MNDTPQHSPAHDVPRFADDEIDLFELFATLKAGWLTWLSTTLLGGALALAAAFSITPMYEATALLRLAQVNGAVSESVGATTERLKSLGFAFEACQQLKLALEDCEGTVQKRLAVSNPKTTDLVQLTYKATSPALAKTQLNDVVALLAQAHADIAAPSITQLRSELSLAEQQLAQLNAQDDQFASRVAQSSSDPTKAAYAVLQLANQRNTTQVQYTMSRVSDLKRALALPNTRPTELMQAIYVKSKPVSPKKALMLAIGALLGGMFGVGWVLVRKAIKARTS